MIHPVVSAHFFSLRQLHNSVVFIWELRTQFLCLQMSSSIVLIREVIYYTPSCLRRTLLSSQTTVQTRGDEHSHYRLYIVLLLSSFPKWTIAVAGSLQTQSNWFLKSKFSELSPYDAVLQESSDSTPTPDTDGIIFVFHLIIDESYR